MELSTISAPVLSSKAYKIDAMQYFRLLRDAAREESWETFGTPSLPIYFSRGMEKFYETLEEFANLSNPFSADIEKQLPFMLDSLLYVRRAIAEIEHPA